MSLIGKWRRGQLQNMVVRRAAASRVMDSKITTAPKNGPSKQQAMVSSRPHICTRYLIGSLGNRTQPAISLILEQQRCAMWLCSKRTRVIICGSDTSYQL